MRRVKRTHTESDLTRLKTSSTAVEGRTTCLEVLDLPLPPLMLARHILLCISQAEHELLESESSLVEDLPHFYLETKAYLAALKESIRNLLPSLPSIETLTELPSPLMDLPSWPTLETLQALISRMHDLAAQLPSSSELLPTPPSLSFDTLRAYLQKQQSNKSLKRPRLKTRRSTFSNFVSKFDAYGTKFKDAVKYEGEKLAEKVKVEGEKFAGILSHEAELFKEALLAGKSRLLQYHELPFSWRNNQYIIRGYRFYPIESWRSLLFSLFAWHNETINIYTHLIGFLAVIYWIHHLHPYTPQASEFYDNLVSLSFLFCAATCLLLSSLWHLCSGCATYHIFNSAACFDYTGVSALICSSVFTMLWYGFYCRPDLLQLYGTASLVIGVTGLILPWAKWFNERENKGWRIAFFLSMCLSAVAPQVHMMYLYGIRETILFFGPVLMSACSYVVGLILYGFNVPESFRPGGLFDYVAHSHQFWHIAILIAIYLQWRAITYMHEIGTTQFSCAAPSLDTSSSILHSIQQGIQGYISSV